MIRASQLNALATKVHISWFTRRVIYGVLKWLREFVRREKDLNTIDTAIKDFTTIASENKVLML